MSELIVTSAPRAAQVTGHTFEVESDTFKLRNITEAPLLKHKEEVEVSLEEGRQTRPDLHPDVVWALTTGRVRNATPETAGRYLLY